MTFSQSDIAPQRPSSSIESTARTVTTARGQGLLLPGRPGAGAILATVAIVHGASPRSTAGFAVFALTVPMPVDSATGGAISRGGRGRAARLPDRAATRLIAGAERRRRGPVEPAGRAGAVVLRRRSAPAVDRRCPPRPAAGGVARPAGAARRPGSETGWRAGSELPGAAPSRRRPARPPPPLPPASSQLELQLRLEISQEMCRHAVEALSSFMSGRSAHLTACRHTADSDPSGATERRVSRLDVLPSALQPRRHLLVDIRCREGQATRERPAQPSLVRSTKDGATLLVNCNYSSTKKENCKRYCRSAD